MKTIKFFNLKITLFLMMILMVVSSCTRDISDDATLSTFSKTAEVFTDAPIGMGSNFYFPYGADAGNPIGSKLNAWTVDQLVSYKGTASMRFDVPDGDDLTGNYAGGIFRIDGAGRNLTGYDALTFWAKASQNVTITEIGFGEDFFPNKFVTTMRNLDVTTNWVKYVIPIPDASKLVQEKGMLRYATGGTGVDKRGYTFWIDELKFEKLNTIAHPMPAILNGASVNLRSYIGTTYTIAGLTQTFNMSTGLNQTVSAASSYFNFVSSNTSVATVSDAGVVTIVGTGTAVIKGTLAGVDCTGALNVISLGTFVNAPTPSLPASSVKSIYSDAYVPATASNFDPQFGGSTTQTSESINSNNAVRSYTANNYTGIIFNNTVDATSLTRLHIDIFTQNANTNVGIQIRDIGANGVINTDVNTGNPTGDDKDLRFTASGISVGVWKSFDIVLGGNIANQKNRLGALILTGGPDFIVDNIYFY